MAELAPKDVVAALRRPKQIFTQDFLNDPLRFNTDVRFDVETLLRDLNTIPVIERDQAEFAVIDLGAEGTQLYPAAMFTTDYKQADVLKKIKTKIIELLPV